MRTIAFINQKGGTGKSTLAACLAVAAKDAGERVFLIDMDPQKSLIKWGYRRESKDLPVEAVSPAKLESVLAALDRGHVGLVIIDTPAGDSPAAEAAMACADLCVIPARPTIFDIWSSETTRGKLKTLGKDYAFVLTHCSPMPETARVRDGAAALEAMGAPAAAVCLRPRRLSGGGARGHGRHGSRAERQSRRRDAPALEFAGAPLRAAQTGHEGRTKSGMTRLGALNRFKS